MDTTDRRTPDEIGRRVAALNAEYEALAAAMAAEPWWARFFAGLSPRAWRNDRRLRAIKAEIDALDAEVAAAMQHGR